MRSIPSRPHHFALIGLILTLGLVYWIAARQFVFGSVEGRWAYPYFAPFNAPGVLAFLAVLPIAVALTRLATLQIERREWVCVLSWLVIGFGLQLALRWPYFADLEAIVRSENANSFYSAYYQVIPERTFVEFLRDFRSIAPSFPVHARANMPGKVGLFFALGAATTDPQLMAYLIIAISNLGGILIYLIAREMFGDRRTGLFALVLYLLLPCKLFFFPLLNIVSPVFVLASFYAHLRYLATGRSVYAAVLGFLVYATAFFDPLSLAMGLLFLTTLVRAVREGEIGRASIAFLVLYSGGAFALTYLAMLLVCHYDLIGNFFGVWRDAVAFNEGVNRNYAIWVVQNLREFLVNVGLGISILCFGVLFEARRPKRAGLWNPPVFLALSLFAILVVLDVLGVNRGEVVRLWIFLASFFPLVAAHVCARSEGTVTFSVVLAAILLQSAISVSMVAFVVP